MRIKHLIAVCLILLGTFCLADELTITSDITRLGVGARPLGMGKMFTGLSDDVSAIYLNPGGLANLKDLEVLSMSGRFANEVNYLTLATAIPTKYGTFGIGYAGTGFGFETPVLNLVEIATGEYRVIPSTNEGVAYNYNNYALAFAYGTTLRPNLTLGTSLKLFAERISGSSSANANGFDMDLGLLYQRDPNLTLGALMRNFLPEGLGGKTTWDTGQTEYLPTSYVLGGSYKLQMPRNAGNITLGSDLEYRPYISSLPFLWHLGVEWWPLDLLAVRAGIDQDVVGRGSGTELSASNNNTLGLSLNLTGLRFDYAYHQYNNVPQNDTHYFSIVYAYHPPKKIPLEISAPQDKLVTNQPKVTIRGTAKDPAVATVKINNDAVGLAGKDKVFEKEIDLSIGRNFFTVSAYDNKGVLCDQKPVRLVRLLSFSDVGQEYWAREPIELLATLGFITGYPDKTFGPDKSITRAELTTLMVKLKKGTANVPAADKAPFSDVDLKHWAVNYISSGVAEGLVTGYPDNTFQPKKPITRAEGVAVMARFGGLSREAVEAAPFNDVPGRHWAAPEIAAALRAGYLKFLTGKNFEPGRELTRAEAAEILARTRFGSENIKILVDFD